MSKGEGDGGRLIEPGSAAPNELVTQISYIEKKTKYNKEYVCDMKTMSKNENPRR